MNDNSKYRYHLGQQPIFNNNIFGIIGAEISPTNIIWRIDVVEIVEGGIENSSYSNNDNDNDNNNNTIIIIIIE